MLCLSVQRANATPPVIDTAVVRSVSISEETEKSVFSDKGYLYKEDEIKRSRNFIQEFLDWLFRDKPEEEEEEDQQSTDSSGSWDGGGFWNGTFIGNLIIVLCIIAVLGGLVYLIATGKWKVLFTPKPAENPFDFKEITEDIEGLNIDKLIEEARLAGNFRLATRWWYLKLLKKFTGSSLIDWKPHKTNLEYYQELQHTQYIVPFKKASYIYEHVWYGEMPVTEEVYAKYIPEFAELERSIHA